MTDIDPRETKGQRIARLVLALLLLGLGIWTIHNFLPALIWAAVIAIAVWPLFWRARQRYPAGRHNLVLPGLFTLALAVVFVGPLILAGVPLAEEVHGAMHWLADVQRNGVEPPDWLSHLPVGSAQAHSWWERNLANPGSTGVLLRKLMDSDAVMFGRNLGSQLFHRVVLFGFTLLTLFFLFRHGTEFAEELVHVSQKLFGPRGERIGRQMVASVHGTVSGLVLVGLGEGCLLGIVYAIAGVPRPILFGIITGVAAIIPFGAIVAYGIASALLLINGLTGAAIAVFVAGSLILFIADHFVRPVLIGGATRLPFLWVLFGILGGVEVWGILGLFVGPALMAALILLWRELAEETPPV